MENKTIKYILFYLILFIIIILIIISKEIWSFILVILKILYIILNIIIKVISLILLLLVIIDLSYKLYKKYQEIIDYNLQQLKEFIYRKKKEEIKKRFIFYFLIIITPVLLIIFTFELWEFIFILLKFTFKTLNVILKLILIIYMIVQTYLFYKKYKKEIEEKLEQINEYIDDKVEIIREKIRTYSDPQLRNARKLMKLFLSEQESFEYRKFASIIYDFSPKDFKKLFEGRFKIDNDEEINNFCSKYDIEDKKGFKLLILKFQNFQTILYEWYEDETKHEYLKKLWLLYPTLYKLKDKNEEELEKELSKINYSEWNKDDKITFKQCIENSPEIKAIQYNNYIEENIEEFGILIGNCVQFNNSFKDYEDMKEYRKTNNQYIKNLLKKGLKIKNNISDKINTFKDAIESRTINCVIQQMTKKVKENIPTNDSFKKLINLVKGSKIKDFIVKNDDLFSGINTAFTFFELGVRFLDLINCFRELKKIDDCYFYYKLRDINENFQKHKSEIKYIKGNDKEDLKLILSIIKKINQDRDDIIELIRNVSKEKDEEEKNKNKNIVKTAKRVAATAFYIAAGAYFTGSLSTILGISGAIKNTFKAFKSGTKIIGNIQKIKYYEKLLDELIEKQKEIEKEIKALKNMYFNIKYSHCPKDIQEKAREKYSLEFEKINENEKPNEMEQETTDFINMNINNINMHTPLLSQRIKLLNEIKKNKLKFNN